MPTGFDVDTLVPVDVSTVAADVGAEMVDFDDTTHDAAFVQFEVDTDNTFPDPTELGDDVDIGIVAQNNQVFKRSDDLQPDTDYFIRAQAENVVYSDDTLFSNAAKSSQGFINDISEKDLSNAAAEPLASEAMTQFTNSRTNLLTYSNVVSDFWGADSPTQAFWDAGSFNQDNTQFGLWQIDLDLSSISTLDLKLRGGASRGSDLTETESTSINSNAFNITYSEQSDTIYVGNFDNNEVYAYDGTTLDSKFTRSDAIDINSYMDTYDGNLIYVDDNSTVKIVTPDNTVKTSYSTSLSYITWFDVDYVNGKILTGRDSNRVEVIDQDGNQVLDRTFTQDNAPAFFDTPQGNGGAALENSFVVYNGGDGEVYKFGYSTPDSGEVLNNTTAGANLKGTAGGDFVSWSGSTLKGHDLATGDELWSASISISNTTVFPVECTDDGIFAGDSSITRVSNNGNVIYENQNPNGYSGTGINSSSGFQEDVYLMTSGTLYAFENGVAGPAATVRVGDSNTLYSQVVSSDSYSSESFDVSSFSGVQTVYLGLSGEDISPDNYAQGTYNGATGSGNSLYVYNDAGSVGNATNFAEFSDITLT